MDRSKMTREELLSEIQNAELILDGCGAFPGLTLWGRIASIKPRLTHAQPDAAPLPADGDLERDAALVSSGS